jgi:elongation factor Ts
MTINMELIQKLREETGAGVMRVKKVLEEVGGDEKKAFEILKKEGFEKVAKREGRETGVGIVAVYSHHTKQVGSMVEILCETDFVARNELVTNLADMVVRQVASMDPQDNEELLGQDYIKEPSKKISDLVNEVIAKTGENVKIGRFSRVEIGK